MGSISISDSFGSNGSPPNDLGPAYQLQDPASFPSLLSNSGLAQPPGLESPLKNLYPTSSNLAPPPGLSNRGALAPEFIPSRPVSRASSSKGPTNIPSNNSFDESDAFPTLGAAVLRGARKHHGKRGHGHGHKDNKEGPVSNSSLADIVRNTPASPVSAQSPRRSLRRPGSYTGTRENSAAALAIPVPEHIPWLETGDRANKEYLKARAEAIKHGGARNKFLQRYVFVIVCFRPCPVHGIVSHLLPIPKTTNLEDIELIYSTTVQHKPGTAPTCARPKTSPSAAKTKTTSCEIATAQQPKLSTTNEMHIYLHLARPLKFTSTSTASIQLKR